MFSAEPMEAMFHEHLTYPLAISSSFPPYKKIQSRRFSHHIIIPTISSSFPPYLSSSFHENLDFLQRFPA
jgi:hypothetical protein